MAVVIAAGQPSAALTELVRALGEMRFAAIVVVDDGAGPQSQEAFARLAELPNVRLVRHAVPIGKGGALKSGIHFVLANFPDLAGVVTADAASAPDAVQRTAEALRERPESLIFDSGQSRATAWTSPRGIPAGLAREALQIETNGDRFERQLLQLARLKSIPVHPDPARRVPAGVFAALAGLIVAAGVALEIHGLRIGNLFAQDIWAPDGARRFAHYVCVCLVVAVPVMVLVPWCFTGLAVGLAAVGTALAAGPLALLAVALFLVSACALGSRILGHAHDTSLSGQALATMVGTAVYIFLMTFLARLPVNYPLVWSALLIVPIAWDWRGVRLRLAACGGFVRHAELRSWGERAAALLLVFVLGMHWLVALKPEVSADGLAMHLAIPVNLAAQHRLTFEPSRFIWSVMPMGADWIYSIVYQIGGEAASRLADFAMLLALEALLYGAARRWLTRSAALLVTALFATTPMVQLVTGSLFVENPLAALILAMLLSIWRLGETGERRYLFAAAILAGGALSTKFGALAFVVLALPFAVAEARRQWRALSPRPLGACLVALLLFAATAAPTYAIAYHKTHNPLFPFLNRQFPSPWLDPTAETFDPRYHDPVNPRMLYELTFHTENFYEASDGSFGFQYLVLAPLALAGLLTIRSRAAVTAAIVGLAASIVILRSDSNARYIYPALPTVTIAFAAVLGWTASHRRALYRALIVCCVLWAGLNIYFLPASGWYHRDFYSPYTFARHGAERYLERAAPERLVIQRYNRLHPGSTLLLPADTNIADVQGEVYENSWHQWNVAISIQHALELPAMRRLFDQWKVKYFISPTRQTSVTLTPASLRDFLDYCTVPEYELGGYALSRLAAECRPEEPHTPGGHVDNRPLAPVSAGTYDDFDDSLHFNGDWEHQRSFKGPYLHTISFTDQAGADVQFAFTGQAVTYLFTTTFNRGFAEVSIDGADRGALDLYSPKTEFQVARKFTVPSGSHVIRIRVAGRKSPQSSGRFVDVDGFVVE
jgi:hypothetical protein